MADEAQIRSDVAQLTQWAARKKISEQALDVLTSMGFTSMESMAGIAMEDMKKTAIPIGQQKLICKAARASFLTQDTVTDSTQGPSVTQTSHQEGEANGSGPATEDPGEQDFVHAIMAQLKEGQGNAAAPAKDTSSETGMLSWQDPQAFLTSYAPPKTPHHDIVDFVQSASLYTDKVITTDGDIQLVCRSGAKKPKLDNLTLSQWSMANINILHKLVDEGSLCPTKIFDYMAYTKRVYSLIATHDLLSVFLYDREYRRLQHQHKFRWGTNVGHLSDSHLRLKPDTLTRALAGGTKGPQSTKQSRSGPGFASHTQKGEIICKKYNSKAGCTVHSCRYAHVCSVPGCCEKHAYPNHSGAKNERQ